jgi:hypothetical protein
MRVLVIGDTHIPRRASWIPQKITEFIEGREFDIVVCTGDLTDRKVLDYLKGISSVVVVRGNMDHLNLPEYAKIKLERIEVGVIHGDQVYPRGDREQLEDIGEEMGIDVLICGHTHSPDLYQGDVIILNPGSATGVWGGGGGSMRPSFMILDVKDKEIDVKLYEMERRKLNWKSFKFSL